MNQPNVKKDYKKTYKLLGIYIASLFIILIPLAILLSSLDVAPNIIVSATWFFVAAWFYSLLLIIHITERVYYYTCVTYEESLEAGSDRRRAYSLALLKRFALPVAVILALSCVNIFVDLGFAVVVGVSALCLIVAAITTVKIKL